MNLEPTSLRPAGLHPVTDGDAANDEGRQSASQPGSETRAPLLRAIRPRELSAVVEPHRSEGRAPIEVVPIALACLDASAALGTGLVVLSLVEQAVVSELAFCVLFGGVLAMLLLRRLGAYKISARPAARRLLGVTLLGLLGVAVAMDAVFLVAGTAMPIISAAFLWLAGLATAALLGRLWTVWVIHQWRKTDRLHRNVVFVGATEIARRAIEAIDEESQDDVRVVGLYDDRLARCPDDMCGRPILGTIDELLDSPHLDHIDTIVVALPWSAEARILEILKRLRNVPSDIALAPDLAMDLAPRSGRRSHGGLMGIVRRPLANGTRWIKAAEDRVLGGMLLVMLAPVIAAIACLIRLDSRGPVFFLQDRFGLRDEVIRVFKFRTMHVADADPLAERQTAVDDPRVTRIGYYLRKYSLDELPQLINVVRGEMSLIGPRPYALRMGVEDRLVKDILTEYALRRHVKPGMTGWAQINGHNGPVRSLSELHARTEYDLHYIDNWSPLFDLRILWKTVSVVVSGRANA